MTPGLSDQVPWAWRHALASRELVKLSSTLFLSPQQPARQALAKAKLFDWQRLAPDRAPNRFRLPE
jgi:hypothetical protein